MNLKSIYAAVLAALTVFSTGADEPATVSPAPLSHAQRKQNLRASGESFKAFYEQMNRNKAEKRISQGDHISENARGALPEMSQDSVHAIADLADKTIADMPLINSNQCGILRIAFREPTRPDLHGEGIYVMISPEHYLSGGESSFQQSDANEAQHAAKLASSLGIQKQVQYYDDLVTVEKPFVAKITIENFGC